MMSLIEEKKALRHMIRQRVRELTPDYCQVADAAICDRALSLDAYKKAHTVFCYVGMAWEINTRPLLRQTLADGKVLGVPLCVAKGIMEVRRIEGLDDLEEGQYGLLEPKRTTPLIAPEDIDLAFVPCCTCTTDGRRLGFGGGYYDRYLAQSSFTTAVLCRSRIRVDTLPMAPYDQLIDLVISDDGVFYKK